jgi:pSer/pThr/pTyr-binding forkhead associated (FHA) protein
MENNSDDGQNTPSDPLLRPSQDTFIVNNKHSLRRALGLTETDDLTPLREIILLVRGITERIPLTDDLSIVLGRADLKTGYKPEVDLTPYGAQNRGVSRSHLRLYVDQGQLYVTDLDSANGSFIGDQRLMPNEPHPLKTGDLVYLGSLPVQIIF